MSHDGYIYLNLSLRLTVQVNIDLRVLFRGHCLCDRETVFVPTDLEAPPPELCAMGQSRPPATRVVGARRHRL